MKHIQDLRKAINDKTYDFCTEFNEDNDYCDFVVIAAKRQIFKQDLISVLVNTYKNLDAYVIAEVVDVAYHDFLYNGFDVILNSAVAMCKIYDALNLKYKCTPKSSK